jgi:2-iminobutanoate/2-iminopropanoate deaminase
MILGTACLVTFVSSAARTPDAWGREEKPGKQILLPPNLKPSSRPYSAGVKVGNMVFLSGVLGTHVNTNELVSPDVSGQTRQCLEKFKAVLSQAGMDLGDAVSVMVYLADLRDYDEMNKVYSTYFPKDPPARACVQAGALLMGAKVEISMIAADSSSAVSDPK